MPKETIPVTVYVAQGLMEAQVIKSRLESEGIPAMLKYESAGNIIYGMMLDGLGEVKVMVPESLADEARTVLKEAEESEDDEPQ
jgi:hypothetical protein